MASETRQSSPPLRIVHVTPSHFGINSVIGGGERYCANVMKACDLAAGERSVRISQTLASFARSPAQSDGVVLVRGDYENIRSIDMAGLRRVIGAHDVVHVHQCLTMVGLLAASEARLAGKVVVGTDHGGGEHHLLREIPTLANVYDQFHAQSDFAALAFADFRIPVRVIRGPVDDRLNGPDPALHSQHATVRDGGIVSVGRVLPHKGFESIIDAVDKTGPRVTIVGQVYDPDYKAFLDERAVDKPVSFRSDLTDHDLVELLSRCQLYIHPSTHHDFRGHTHYKPELLGLAPLEALSQGVPVIVSKAGSLGELARLRGCQTFNSPADLRQRLNAVLARPVDPEESARIRADCIRVYGLESFGRAYLSWICELTDAYPDHQ